MDVRQTPPRILYIVAWALLIGVLGSLLWLIIAPPAAYAPYQHWFQAAFDLVFGGIFIACGLFYHSWFGPNRARMWYIVLGLTFLTPGVIGFLLHSR